MTPAGEVQEMPKELILEIVESYKKAGKLCKDCGFDMVQVHADMAGCFPSSYPRYSIRERMSSRKFGKS